MNLLAYAYREDAPRHAGYRLWLDRLVNGPEALAVSTLVLSGFLRVVTHPRVLSPPSPIGHALAFSAAPLCAPGCVMVEPGPRHWIIFQDLCRDVDARGNLVPDAFLAALAIESGCEWITTDRDFARFPGLRWSHPLDV